MRKWLPFLVSAALLVAMLPLAALPPPVGAPRAYAAPTTIDFNDIDPVAHPNLDGEYPVGTIDWGSGQWLASGPYGTFTDTSISYTTAVPTSGEFELIGDLRLVGFQASNGSDRSSVVSASCGDDTVTQTVPGNSLVTFTTNWYDACSLVTLSSSNGWDTNFDNLIIDSSVPAPTPTPTPTPTATPAAATATPTPAPLCEIQVRINGGLPYWVPKPFSYCQAG